MSREQSVVSRSRSLKKTAALIAVSAAVASPLAGCGSSTNEHRTLEALSAAKTPKFRDAEHHAIKVDAQTDKMIHSVDKLKGLLTSIARVEDKYVPAGYILPMRKTGKNETSEPTLHVKSKGRTKIITAASGKYFVQMSLTGNTIAEVSVTESRFDTPEEAKTNVSFSADLPMDQATELVASGVGSGMTITYVDDDQRRPLAIQGSVHAPGSVTSHAHPKADMMAANLVDGAIQEFQALYGAVTVPK